MKKLISALIFCSLLVCSVLPLAVSADGMILWTDDFSTMQEDGWLWEGEEFFIENGKLEGWAEAVVHQSNFLEEFNGTKRFKECAFKVTACGLEDGGRDADDHALGLWWADYINPNGLPDNDGQIVYTLFYHFEDHRLTLNASFDGDGENFMPADYDKTKPVLEYIVPDDQAAELDPTGNSEFTLGMRILNGVISCFYNDQKVLELNAYRGALTGTQLGAPIIFWNSGCHCTFDDFIVATADYNLFNETAAPQITTSAGANGADTGANGGNNEVPTETEVVTRVETSVVVVGTDEQGNAITEVVSEVVSEVVNRPAANTNSSSPSAGNGGSQTGDMAVIVVAVMIVSLGAAIVVRKVSAR